MPVEVDKERRNIGYARRIIDRTATGEFPLTGHQGHRPLLDELYGEGVEWYRNQF